MLHLTFHVGIELDKHLNDDLACRRKDLVGRTTPQRAEEYRSKLCDERGLFLIAYNCAAKMIEVVFHAVQDNAASVKPWNSGGPSDNHNKERIRVWR